MVNFCDTLRFTNPAIPSSQRIAAMLERLQAESTSARPNVVYVYDLAEQQTLYSSGSVAALLGFTAVETERLGELGLATLIHPDDLQIVSDYFQRFATLPEGEVVAIDYRMQRVDGSWCWLRSHETLFVQADDQVPSQVLGLIQDMSSLSEVSPEKHLTGDRDFNPYLTSQQSVEKSTHLRSPWRN